MANFNHFDKGNQKNRDLTIKEGILFALGSGLLYLALVWINNQVLAPTTVFAGVTLFYLPAGAKLAATLVGRHWGTLGLWCANFLISLPDWQETPVPVLALQSFVWSATPLLVVLLLLRTMDIGADLRGLSFRQFVLIDACVSLSHGFLFNAFLVAVGTRALNDLVSSATAMALGDFLGSGAFVLAIWSLAWAASALKRR